MNLYSIRKYANYLFHARHRNGHGIHSPFVFDLLINVIEMGGVYYSYPSIDSLRYHLSQSNQIINVTDFGAGSKKTKKTKRKIKDICNVSSIKTKYGRLLFRLVNRFQPQVILEFGTNLGLGSLYMAKANSDNKVYTIEGCPELAAVAKKNIEMLEVKNIEINVGNFDKILPEILKKIKKVDFVFFDGNHTLDATVKYFEQCIDYKNEYSIFVFDDIHWSHEMDRAWEYVKKHDEVTVTIDLFQLGIVFFRKSLSKQNFIIKF